jgi:hypothetical protein
MAHKEEPNYCNAKKNWHKGRGWEKSLEVEGKSQIVNMDIICFKPNI